MKGESEEKRKTMREGEKEGQRKGEETKTRRELTKRACKQERR